MTKEIRSAVQKDSEVQRKSEVRVLTNYFSDPPPKELYRMLELLGL